MPGSSPSAASQRTSKAAADGEVLGRNERFVIYRPTAGDSLDGIATRFLGTAEQAWVIGDFNEVQAPLAGEPLVVPLTPPHPAGVGAERYQTVTILCYHRFSARRGAGKMSVAAEDFAAQMDWLARNGYHVVRLAELPDFLSGRRALPRRSVVITMDDGYESVHRYAMPLLRQYGFPATVFVYTDFIGTHDGLSWAQLQEMVASGLVDVEPHSKTHRNLLERTQGESDDSYRARLEVETRAPRELLQRRLGIKVRSFAFPYGDANQAVIDLLGREHYQLGVTVTAGGNPFFAEPALLRRTMIFGDADLENFKSKLQTSRGFLQP